MTDSMFVDAPSNFRAWSLLRLFGAVVLRTLSLMLSVVDLCHYFPSVETLDEGRASVETARERWRNSKATAGDRSSRIETENFSILEMFSKGNTL